MKQLFIFLMLFTSTLLFSNKSLPFNCPQVAIEKEDNKLKIKNLSAAIEIVKVFNKNYTIVYQCNGDCPENIELSELEAGIYHLDIQSYTSNWQFICDKKQSVTITDGNSGTPSCANIQIKVVDNNVVLSNLTAPNKIVKVFDVFYDLIYQCNYNCGTTINIPNFQTGEYHIDIQFYTLNWQFICEKKQDVLVDNDPAPCDQSPCLGNIQLKTQAEIDAFCACKVIKGNLTIGKIGGSNITSLSNLRKVEQINGDLSIFETSIKNLEGLGNLGIIGKGFSILDNSLLEDFTGLENVIRIGTSLVLKNNPKIRNLREFTRLTDVKTVNLDDNDNLQSVEKLAQITELKYLTLTNNRQLEELPKLLLVDSLFGLTLTNNNNLKNIDFLRPIDYLKGQVKITQNPSLSDACGIVHLIDGDDYFGSNDAIFTINNNTPNTNSIAAILQDCQSSDPSCTDIQVTAIQNKITISGLTAPHEIVKVFGKDYAVLFNCFGNCSEPIQVNNLSEGTYNISIIFYDESWIPICELNPRVILGSGTPEVQLNPRAADNLLPVKSELYTLSPNPVSAYTYLDLSDLKGQSVQLQIVNQFGQKMWSKQLQAATSQPEKIAVSTLENGLYFLQIQTANRLVVSKKLMVGRMY